MTLLMCPRCTKRRERGVDRSAPSPHCAFPTGRAFVPTNYDCATINALRKLCDRIHNKPEGIIWGWQYNDALDAGNIGVLRIPKGETSEDGEYVRAGGYIVIMWHRDPHIVTSAYAFTQDNAHKLTLDEAEYAIKALSNVAARE